MIPESKARSTNNQTPQGQKSVSKLMPAVYDELRRLARHYLRHERPGQSLQATALVNEAYLRLIKDKKQPWHDRTHFLGIAAHSMRQILVERARARNAAKRGGSRIRISLDEAIAAETGKSIDLLALDEALDRLASLDPVQSRIVELRYFAGLSIEDCAGAMSISAATVKRDWNMARAWLRREMERDR